jgi:hypothetical protein
MTAARVADFWHGTSTAVLDGTKDVELAPAAEHSGPQVWTPETGVHADPKYLHVGDHIAIAFALITSEILGGNPVVAVVRLPVDNLKADPVYLSLANPPREHRGWFSSYVACGRVVYPGRARPFASYVCQDALELGGAIKGTGLDRQVKMWTDPECWRVDAKRLGLGPEVDGPLAFRERVGKGLWKTCFQKL